MRVSSSRMFARVCRTRFPCGSFPTGLPRHPAEGLDILGGYAGADPRTTAGPNSSYRLTGFSLSPDTVQAVSGKFTEMSMGSVFVLTAYHKM